MNFAIFNIFLLYVINYAKHLYNTQMIDSNFRRKYRIYVLDNNILYHLPPLSSLIETVSVFHSVELLLSVHTITLFLYYYHTFLNYHITFLHSQ